MVFEETSTVTVLRKDVLAEDGLRFLTIEVDLATMEVVNALDEDGARIALSPGEEKAAQRMVRIGLDETGR